MYWRISPLVFSRRALIAMVRVNKVKVSPRGKGSYGGDGSAVFWPDGTTTTQSNERGIFVVGLYSRDDPEFIKIED